MAGQVPKYTSVPPGERLHQGEILAGLVQVRQIVATIGGAPQIEEITHPFVIVLTQECELSQDFTARQAGDAVRMLPSILLCDAVPTTQLKSFAPQQKELWRQVTRNLDPRFQCLESVPPNQDSGGEGIPSVGCDFKRAFTVPTDEVYRRIELQQIARRTRLVTPYAEHLVQRFSNFLSRIPLEENHDVSL